ncbi:MAG: hypothetical protein ACRCUX_03445 [Beijerinckiaceae bacterium]
MKRNTGVRILVTGFGPFPHVRVNPTSALVAMLAKSRRFARLGIAIEAHVFPTRWSILNGELARVIAHAKADAILHLGVAARRRFISIETMARTGTRALLPDASGKTRPGLHARKGQPSAFRIAASAQRLRAAMTGDTVQVKISNDAGRYLCNALYAQSLALAAQQQAKRRTVFIHVPLPRAPAGTVPLSWKRSRRMSLADMARALEAAVTTLAIASR